MRVGRIVTLIGPCIRWCMIPSERAPSGDQYVTRCHGTMCSSTHTVTHAALHHMYKYTEQQGDTEGAITACYLHHTDGALDHLLVLWLWPTNITVNLVTCTNSQKGRTRKLTSLIDISPILAKISRFMWNWVWGSLSLHVKNISFYLIATWWFSDLMAFLKVKKTSSHTHTDAHVLSVHKLNTMVATVISLNSHQRKSLISFCL